MRERAVRRHRAEHQADFARFAAVFEELAARFVGRRVTVEPLHRRQNAALALFHPYLRLAAYLRRVNARADELCVHIWWNEVLAAALLFRVLLARVTALLHYAVEASFAGEIDQSKGRK